MIRIVAAIGLILVATGAAAAQADSVVIKITAGENDSRDVPICIPLSLKPEWAKWKDVTVEINDGEKTIQSTGQLTAPGISTDEIKANPEGTVRRDLHVILSAMKAKKNGSVNVRFDWKKYRVVDYFTWRERNGLEEILRENNSVYSPTPYLRYVNQPYDTSTPAARNRSYKVFHHLYAPVGRPPLVTNGGHTDNVADPKSLVYPHHRGIMFGFNKCSYGPDLKLQADTWHCPAQNEKKTVVNAAHQAHEKTILTEAGPVLGRHRVLIGWYGSGEKPFLHEERELTVYNVNGNGTLVDFTSRLKPLEGDVKLDGDPQHAGFQFRAANIVAEKTKSKTYFLHPDGKGDLGKTRNWPEDKTMVDLPWYAMSFVIDDKRYTVCYLNHPNNPKETRFSERDYGRFGGYFQHTIRKNQTLTVNYRLWLQTGEMTAEQASALQTAFAAPPK